MKKKQRYGESLCLALRVTIICTLLSMMMPGILISQPTLCTVSGIIYLPDGVTRARNVQVIVREVRDVNQIPILMGPAYYYTNDTGLVAFTVPRQGTMKLEAPTACLNVKQRDRKSVV